MLVITGTAPASLPGTPVLPAPKSSFGGVTSEQKVGGFRGFVSFTVGKTGRSIKGFSFQTLGCFGHGSFGVGDDPYVSQGWVTKLVPASANASVLATVPMTSADNPGYTMSVTIKAAYVSPKELKGTIRINRETIVSNNATCGPYTVRFDAVSPRQNQDDTESND